MLNLECEGLDRLSQRMAAMPQAIREALAQKRDALAQDVLARAQAKLSGEILSPRSGRLRDSLQASPIGDFGAAIYSSGDVKYAAAHEFGFEGNETVSAHAREIRKVFGKAIDAKSIFVAEFSRHIRLPERSYLRSSFDEFEEEILAGFSEAIDEAAQS
jgi:phage gpG-like protein